MQFDDALGDGEAEPAPALLAGARAVDLLELLEDALLVGLRDAGTGVRDRDQERPVRDARLDRDLTDVGELDRVADQVHEDLGQPALVPPPGRQIDRHDRLQGELLPRRQRLHRRRHRVDELPHRVVAQRERELARLDP